MLPAIAEDQDVYALKALAAGVASAGQQQRALRFFLNASGIRDCPRVSDNPLELAFNEGRRFVGWQVARLVELVGITSDQPSQPQDTNV